MAITTIAICDDIREDALALHKQLEGMLPDVDIRLFDSNEQLIEMLEDKDSVCSAVFIGVNMPKRAGLETARIIRKKNLHVPLIIMSDSTEFYKEAFEVYAVDYIKKPVTEEALEHAMYPMKHQNGVRDRRTVHFRYRSQVYTIPYDQIVYISSSLHTVNFHLTNNKIVHCRGKLNDFNKQLETNTFLRCHQSFFVNMEKITAMKNDSFILGESIIPISRSYAREVRSRYKEYLKGMEKSNS